MSTGQRPQGPSSSPWAALFHTLGRFGHRSRVDWIKPSRRGGQVKGGGSQAMKVSKKLSRELENPNTFTASSVDRNKRRNRRHRLAA